MELLLFAVLIIGLICIIGVLNRIEGMVRVMFEHQHDKPAWLTTDAIRRLNNQEPLKETSVVWDEMNKET